MTSSALTARLRACETLDFTLHGVEIRRAVLSQADATAITSEVGLDSEKLVRHGVRNLHMTFPSLARLAVDRRVLELAEQFLQARPQFVRVLFFDKTPSRNWAVHWHQDTTVSLNRRVEMAGWHSWHRGGQVWHVRPPCDVLDRMLAIRLHLDACDESNGCLKVIPASHRLGILRPDALERIVASSEPTCCSMRSGDAVIMRPHVLHASERSARSGHRRVIHLEYSAHRLPQTLRWA